MSRGRFFRGAALGGGWPRQEGKNAPAAKWPNSHPPFCAMQAVLLFEASRDGDTWYPGGAMSASYTDSLSGCITAGLALHTAERQIVESQVEQLPHRMTLETIRLTA